MNNTNHSHRSRRRNHKPLITVLTVFFVLSIAIGGTVAFLVTKTEPVENTFTPTDVSCSVEITSAGARVQNTGKIDAHIRVYVLANYINGERHVCAAHSVAAPMPGDGWTLENGFYYCNTTIAPNAFTPYLYTSHDLAQTAEDGCVLKIEVVASAIQTGDAALKAWKGVG